MKRLVTAAILILFMAGSFGCAHETEDSSVPETTVSLIYPTESSEESSKESYVLPSTEESSLPDNVSEDKSGYLKYTNNSGDLSATFPDEFSVLCTEYTPTDGIYLQNSDGTATLQIEAVLNEGADMESLVDFLSEQYPDAKVNINDSKKIICKSFLTDGSGNKVMCCLKAVITNKGYNEAVLYFDEKDRNKYESLFGKISIS